MCACIEYTKIILSGVFYNRYHSAYRKRREPATRFMFHCAQANTCQHKPKKCFPEDSNKARDKDRMYTFKCSGWLHITITDDTDIAYVKYKHEDQHIPYWDIEVAEEIKTFVRENIQMTPTQVCNIIFPVKDHVLIKFQFSSYGTRY